MPHDDLDGEGEVVAHIAYCWKSGEIEFAEVTDDLELPHGVIAFAMGRKDDLFDRCAVRARLSYKGKFLVPVVVWPFVGSLHTQPAGDICAAERGGANG